MKELKDLRGAKILSKSNQRKVKGGIIGGAPTCKTDAQCLAIPGPPYYIACISGFCVS